MKNFMKFWSLYLEESALLARPRHRWYDNIKMDFEEVRGYGMDSLCSEHI
jgi:hypothetical protein